MKRFFHTYFLYICSVLEIAIIVMLCIYIYQKKNGPTVLGKMTTAPLRKDYLIFPTDSPLTYYYEPKPSIIEEEQPAWLDYTATYTINADSLNERHDYAIEKSTNVYRILALGDSFTFGHYVNTADNWTERLEDRLNAQADCDGRQYEVINLGERGYDVQYIAYRYKNRGKKYNPDFIIWHESGSGFSRILELLYPMVERNNQELSAQDSAMIDEHPNADPALWKALKELRQKYGNDKLFEQIYASWLDFFKVRGTTPVLVATFSYIPPIDLAKLKYWTRNQENAWIYAGIPNIYELGGGLPDGHPNAKGHVIVAESIFQHMRDVGILACNK